MKKIINRFNVYIELNKAYEIMVNDIDENLIDCDVG